MSDILPCMETVFLVLLIATFLAIGAMAVLVLLKLFAGQR
jgi:hypothetical protein